MYQVLFFITVFLPVLYTVHINDWDYGEHGPDAWDETYPTCGGQVQSPINILTACTVYKNFSSFTFGSGYAEEHHFTLTNNGHTIVGTFNSEAKLPTLSLISDSINGTLDFVNFHLHWGENHRSGSEHEV